MRNIIMLDIPFSFGEVNDVIHPVLLQDEKNLVLIDCGYIGFLPLIEQAIKDKGLDCHRLTHVVITHQDHDHMGALWVLKQKYPQVQVVASEVEAPYISGTEKSLRLVQAEQMQEFLPEEQKEFGLKFCELLRSVKTVPVDCCVKDGDVMDWCGGCKVIATPGHTPGHLSFSLEEGRIIVAGDAAVLENGRLIVANPQFALDLEQAEQSFQKITECGAQKIYCYHGGLWQTPEKTK